MPTAGPTILNSQFLIFNFLRGFLKSIKFIWKPICCFEHSFSKNSVALCRVIHQHMGHSAHQLAVLDDRTAAHGWCQYGTTNFFKFPRLQTKKFKSCVQNQPPLSYKCLERIRRLKTWIVRLQRENSSELPNVHLKFGSTHYRIQPSLHMYFLRDTSEECNA